jgi:hypothetical protein
MPDPIVIKGKLYLERCLNAVWTYDKDDKYTNLIDQLGPLDLHQVTIVVTVDESIKGDPIRSNP